jgi:DNA-binding beta-propeller fold protein YncE
MKINKMWVRAFVMTSVCSVFLSHQAAHTANFLVGVEDFQNITMYDVFTRTFSGGIALLDPIPRSIAVTPDNEFAYVTTSGLINVINLRTNQVVARVSSSNGTGIAIAPNQRFAYAAANGNTTVDVIDLTTNTVVASIPVTGANYLTVTPDSSLVYVTHGTSVSIISAATNTVIAPSPLAMGGTAGQIVMAPNGNAFVAAGAAGVVLITPAFTTQTFATSASPDTVIAIDPTGRLVFSGQSAGGITSVQTSSPFTITDYTLGLSNVTAIGIAPNGLAFEVNTSTGFLFFSTYSPASAIDNTTALGLSGGGQTSIAVAIIPTASSSCAQNKFFPQVDRYITVTWVAPNPGEFLPQQYLIYRDAARTQLAGTVDGDQLFFEDHNRKKGETYTYYVVAQDGNGTRVGLGKTTQQCN